MSQQPQPSPEHVSSDDSQKSKDAAALPNRSSPRWLVFLKPKVGIPLAILLVLVSIPLAYRSWRISSLPPIDEPFDVKAFLAETVTDEENAFVEYRRAFAMLVDYSGPSNVWDSYHERMEGRWDDVPSDFEPWFKANESTLEMWLEGTKKPKGCFTPRRKFTIVPPDYPSDARTLARLAVLKAGKLTHDGNVKESWELLHGAFRFSLHVGQSDTLIERLTAAGIQPLIHLGLCAWAHHPKTTAADLERASDALSNDYCTLTRPLSVTLKTQYVIAKPMVPLVNQGIGVFHDNSTVEFAYMFVIGEPQFSELALKHVLANQLEGVDDDLSTRPPFVPGSNCLFDLPLSASRPLSGADLEKTMIPVPAIDLLAGLPQLKLIIAVRDHESLRHSSLLAVLAIERFVRRNGRFPASLEECSQIVDSERFSDPYQTANRPLIFRANADYAVVYSLGTDGVDDAYPVEPPDGNQQSSITRLSHLGHTFEGYRIPLWRPESDADVDEDDSVVSDNVQD